MGGDSNRLPQEKTGQGIDYRLLLLARRTLAILRRTAGATWAAAKATAARTTKAASREVELLALQLVPLGLLLVGQDGQDFGVGFLAALAHLRKEFTAFFVRHFLEVTRPTFGTSALLDLADLIALLLG